MGVKKNQFIHKSLFAFTEVITPPPVPTPPPTPPAPPTPPPPPVYAKEFTIHTRYAGNGYYPYWGSPNYYYKTKITLGATRSSFTVEEGLTASDVTFIVTFGYDPRAKDYKDIRPGGLYAFAFKQMNGDNPLDPAFVDKLHKRVSRVTINDTEVWKKGVSKLVGGDFEFDNVYNFDFSSKENLKIKVYFSDN